MKYIKLYEFENKYDGIYYFIPYVDADLVRLAIEKLNISKEVKNLIFNDSSFWINLKLHDTQVYGVGCFITVKNDQNQPFTYWICNGYGTSYDNAHFHFKCFYLLPKIFWCSAYH